MEKQRIIELIREEIQSYQNLDAPERMAQARLINKIDKENEDTKQSKAVPKEEKDE